MTPRQARRILLTMLVIAIIGLGIWVWIYTNTLCCAPPHIVP
ncbi:MAG: hypothetical protein QM698_10095 [Micropepsaceae bacterium]